MPRASKAYYSVFALKDGTVLFAKPTRKPLPKTLRQWKCVIDEDGVWREFVEGEKDLQQYKVEIRQMFDAVAATAINVRRAIRALALPSLSQIQRRVDAIQEQLDRIEAAVRVKSADDAVTSADRQSKP